ncbi:MATE family efflux transporter [Aestuariimicrobium sp. T2.26MG-19.2B]|uniref:MATE family efflux transporter n=1 Tax=Aestuariimicrobium sp. T2.26MG-19.2B TaxID=3040679 RepID=UPI002477637C|nr:MATE family efflux transporter [Aestuariimicrobium sp. T2.26MG-19.2B]CAI9403468.1 DNA damage-inducible protein F [Aestuariimicrobium sp. T2.26MG-19.2B]
MSETTGSPRQILSLAVPALATLVAEPLFLLADTAMVGHLGTPALAGLGVAGAALSTAVSIFVFLAYATTAVVARQRGAGRPDRALAAGLDGLWLALGLGLLVAVPTAVFAPTVSGWFGAGPDAVAAATTYLRISTLGIPAMLAVLACSGTLRGFLDIRTPLVTAVFGFGANIVLNYLLIFVAGLGIAGSAWGTVIAQNAMAAALVTVVVRRAIEARATLRPHLGRVWRAALGGVPLLVRTMALRVAMLATTWAAAGFGDQTLAAHQVVFTMFGMLALMLDALAIAAQALTGTALGAGDSEGAVRLTRRLTWWGVWGGLGLSALLAATHRLLPGLFTNDAQVRERIAAGLLTLAIYQAVAGVVFVLDGVLIGAGDGRALAWLQVIVLAVYLPVLVWLHAGAESMTGSRGIVALWLAFGWFLVARMVGLLLRARSRAWVRLGA